MVAKLPNHSRIILVFYLKCLDPEMSLAQNLQGYPVGTTARKSGFDLPAEGSIDVCGQTQPAEYMPCWAGRV
jgi:hypothetical protein